MYKVGYALMCVRVRGEVESGETHLQPRASNLLLAPFRLKCAFPSVQVLCHLPPLGSGACMPLFPHLLGPVSITALMRYTGTAMHSPQQRARSPCRFMKCRTIVCDLYACIINQALCESLNSQSKLSTCVCILTLLVGSRLPSQLDPVRFHRLSV